MAKKLILLGFEYDKETIMLNALLNPKKEIWDYVFVELGGKISELCYITIAEVKHFVVAYEWLEKQQCPKPIEDDLIKLVLRRKDGDIIDYLSKKGNTLKEIHFPYVFQSNIGIIKYFLLRKDQKFEITREIFGWLLRHDVPLILPILDEIKYKITKDNLLDILKLSDTYIINPWVKLIGKRNPELIDDEVLNAAKNSVSAFAFDALLESQLKPNAYEDFLID